MVVMIGQLLATAGKVELVSTHCVALRTLRGAALRREFARRARLNVTCTFLQEHEEDTRPRDRREVRVWCTYERHGVL